MNDSSDSNEQKAADPVATATPTFKPYTPLAAQDAVTTRPPDAKGVTKGAAKGDDDVMSQPPAKKLPL